MQVDADRVSMWLMVVVASCRSCAARDKGLESISSGGWGSAPCLMNSRRRRTLPSVRVSVAAELSFVEMCFELVFIITSYVPKGSCLGIWKSALDRNVGNVSDVVVDSNPDFCIPERHIRSDYEGWLCNETSSMCISAKL